MNHTGAHKINHVIGEALLAKMMGKKKLICETGAGQHGLGLATVAAKLGLDCEVHMGVKDMKKQSINVRKMQMLGAKVVPAYGGQESLASAIDSALKAYADDIENSLYCIGSVVGPHPFPAIVQDLQSIVGEEAREQIMRAEGKLPDALVACVSGGSNAIGLFNDFLEDDVAMYGVEPEGAASLTKGQPILTEGYKTLAVLNEHGELDTVDTVASGLSHPATGPQHAYLHQTGRVKYVTVNNADAIKAFKDLTRMEGIPPALESAHAVAYAQKLARTMRSDQNIIANLSGRGDKDVEFVMGLDDRL